MRYERAILMACVVFLTAWGDALTPTPPAVTAGLSASVRGIRQSYIVRFRDDAPNVNTIIDRLNGKYGGEVRHRWDGSIKGMNILLPPAIAARLPSEPEVAYVDTDKVGYTYAAVQTSPPWGLD